MFSRKFYRIIYSRKVYRIIYRGIFSRTIYNRKLYRINYRGIFSKIVYRSIFRINREVYNRTKDRENRLSKGKVE